MKVTIQKATGEGEYISVEAQIPGDVLKMNDKVRLRGYLSMGIDLIDDRLFEMNRRVLFANELVRQQTPEVQFVIHSILEGMHGVLYRGNQPIVPVGKEVEEQVAKQIDDVRVKVDTERLGEYPGQLEGLRDAGVR